MSRVRFHYRTDEPTGAPDPAPGIGEANPDEMPEDSAAEPSNTDSAEGTPGPIPYSRFKEVNESRRQALEALEPYRALEANGYGAEDLQRLAAWEMEYAQDPVGVWLRHANTLDNLPDSVKAAVAAALEGTSEDSEPKEGHADQPSSESDKDDEGEVPSWFEPYAEEFRRQQVAKEQRFVSETMDLITQGWKELDEKEGLVTPESSMLKHLKLASLEPAENAYEILQRARASFLEELEELRKIESEAIRNTDKAPRSVPGGGSGTPTPSSTPKPKSLREARILAEKAAEAGRLTPLGG